VRALLATAGLLVLAGSAVAARPTVHTLRKSQSGPIVAVAQDNNLAAWFAAGARPCNEVHVMSPGKKDRTLPPPSSDSMTCQWDISGGDSRLALAARMSTALWTLHENVGATSFDQVVAASFSGPERQLERFTHATNGTGDWLGDVAGTGKVLAYSWYDIEYQNPTTCLSGGPCKQKIADGGIHVVTRTDDTPLPGALPALGLATAAGRIAYIPATKAHSGHAYGGHNATLYVVDAGTGTVVGHAFVRGIPAAIALSPHVLAVITQSGPRDRISWFSPTGDNDKLGSVLVSQRSATELAANDQVIVYRVGNQLNSVSTRTGRIHTLAKSPADNSVGLSLARGRLVWAENHGGTGRLRALSVR
jgi:hypothetical protein